MEISKEVAKQLSKYRKISGYSQEKLAELSCVHRTYISQIERALKSPTLETIFKICNALNIKPSQFIKDIEDVL
ncbi:helix-turn-helix transcriptional regulator [bacterium]|nr:helix-turn-helix transcriptional regulator [bacterium]